MTHTEIVKALAEPTLPAKIKFLPRSVFAKQEGAAVKHRALALPFIDARYVQERLDEIAGPLGWQSKIEYFGGFVCVGIAIRDPDTGEWVWKWDTGQDEASSQVPTENGDDDMSDYGRSIVSQGIKRAAYQWNIGRDLYTLPKRWVPCTVKKIGEKEVFRAWDVPDVYAFITANTAP
jgi:hypothetical protein